MKKLFFVFLSLIVSMQALACDDNLQKFDRDCKIQDRLVKVRADLDAKNIDINEFAEHRVIRFVDRDSWNNAKSEKEAPTDIYKPIPITWQVWDEGLRSLFSNPTQPLKGLLFTNFKIDADLLSHINTVLLTDGKFDIKDKISDQTKKDGEFRQNNDHNVGFCTDDQTMAQKIQDSDASLSAYQQRWEQAAGKTLSDVVHAAGGLNFINATLTSAMAVLPDSCSVGSFFIRYAPSNEVPYRVDWIKAFIQANLDLYNNGNAIIAPVEFAAVVQKWLVSTHPFTDGNGRTSRAIEDYILSNFDLPFVPGGDLQDDATANVDTYISNTYDKIESMLSTLENCVHKEGRHGWFSSTPYQCKTVSELITKYENHNNDSQ